MNKKRLILFRALTFLVLVAIAAWMLVIGRGHTVYFDSVAGEYNGTAYETPYKTEVIVKGEKAAKLYDGERGMASWTGQNLKMTLLVTEEKGGEASSYSVNLKLPYNMDGIIINLPALMAGLPQEAYLSEFISTTPEEPEEEVVTDDMNMEMGDI